MRYFNGLFLVSSFALINSNSKWESNELVIATLISLGSVFICFCFAGINFKKPFSTQCTPHQFISVWTLMLLAHHRLSGGGCCEMLHWYCSDKVTEYYKLWECQVCLLICEFNMFVWMGIMVQRSEISNGISLHLDALVKHRIIIPKTVTLYLKGCV